MVELRVSLLSVCQESPRYFKAKLTLIGVRLNSRLHTLCSARGYNHLKKGTIFERDYKGRTLL